VGRTAPYALIGVGCGGKGWASSKKKNHFCTQNVWVHLTVFNRQKTRTVAARSIGWQILQFNRKTKFTKQYKNYPKKLSVRPGGSHHHPPKYTTTAICAESTKSFSFIMSTTER